MMSEIEEIALAISEINGEMFEISSPLSYKYKLEIKSNGDTHLVYFLGNIIHNSEDDNREWNEKNDDYSTTIEEYLRKAIAYELDCLKHLEALNE